MNDPLKNFVEQNRAEFDHLDAPILNLDKLKATLPTAKPARKSTSIFLVTQTKWMVAASVLVALTVSWLLFNNSKDAKVNQIANTHIPSKEIEITQQKSPEPSIEIEASNKHLAVHKDLSATSLKSSELNIYAGLKDSTSASKRLLAIIEIEKSSTINNQVLDMLAQTLNHDKNTNVRLAALSLIEKYSYDNHASSLLVSSLNSQNDPVVQLGLVSLLGKMKNVKIDDKLQSLANSPETFAAVRDEAYNILLNQNKL